MSFGLCCTRACRAAMVGQSHKAKGWEHWTTESIEAHLKTR